MAGFRLNLHGRNAVAPVSTGRFLAVLILAGLTPIFCRIPAAHALPEFSRRYNIPCESCHTVAPALNEEGKAFQANFFNWPGGKDKSVRRSWLNDIPLSAMVTASRVQSLDGTFPTTTAVRLGELFLSDSFSLGANHVGGYFVDYTAFLKDGTAGDLGDAYAAVPFAGNHGQYAILAGQFTPMLYQYDPINSLTQTLPIAIADDADAFSFTAPTPGARVDFFDGRGQGTADGDYVSVGVPVEGHLTLNSEDHVTSETRGAFGQAFRRTNGTSYGVFAFEHNSNDRIGLLGTRDLTPKLSLLAAGSFAHDEIGSHRDFSGQVEWTPISGLLALTGRIESTNFDGFGRSDTYPVAAVTYYPGRQHFLRLTGETDQPKGQRVDSIFVYLQL